MNPKIILAIAAVVAALAIGFLKFRQEEPAAATAAVVTTSPAAGKIAAPASSIPADAPAPPAKKPRVPEKDEALVAEYGDSRTSLSKQVAGNLVGLLDDIVFMGEMSVSGKLGNAMGGGGNLRGAVGPVLDELKLDDEQREKANQLNREFQTRVLAKTKTVIGKLKDDPTPLMKLMLASDAAAQGKITPEEFKTVQEDASGELGGIVNPMDRRNFGREKPLDDPEFSADFREILTPDQVAVLEDSAAKASEKAPEKDPSITAMPPMELEKLDQAVTSGKTITSGLKQMMEGIGSLQDLGPLPGVTGD